MTPPAALTGRCILVVEDDYLVAEDIIRSLEKAGASVIGPVASVACADAVLRAEPRIDGAVLDLNLRGDVSFTIAANLQARGTRFVFTTAYGPEIIPRAFAAVQHCPKPTDLTVLVKSLAA